MSRIIGNVLAVLGGMFGTTAIMGVLLTAPRYVALVPFSNRWLIEALFVLICWSALVGRALSPTGAER